MSANLEAIRVGRDHLFLSSDTVRERRIYRIVSVNIEQRTLRLDGTPRLTTPSEWTVGVPVRTYEVFLPEPTGSQQREWTLTTPVEHPIAYAQVGVSAADGRAHTPDNTRWATSSWGNRTGNEGPVGSPATIFAVRREQPLPAQLPPGAPGRVYATPADYSAQSQFTFRWIAQAGLSVHLFRALDETVFRTHWNLRPFAVDAANRRLFPAEPHWDEPKRTEVATAIETLNTLTDYAVASAIYRALPDDTLRVLAGLPGMEQAFTQITVRPLDPDEPDATEPTLRLWRDRVGPDTSPGYVPDETLRSWVDTLSGRSSNRYLYRAVSVDTAHNRSPLGVPAPPVWLPDITPPHTPVMAAVRSGEGQITLQWTSPREAGLSEYWVYRTESETRAGDLRWMQRIHTQAAPSDQESLPAVEVTWTDHDVTDGAPRYYRLVAVDQTGNVSRPTPIWCSRATDTSPPTPAVWSSARWLLLDAVGTETPWSDVTSNLTPAVSLHWTVEDPRVASLVQRRMGETSLWQTVMPWRSVTTYRDQEVTPDLTYEYRVLTRAPNGQTSTSVSRAASRED
ncbi:hypothetical protein [Deinococcus sp. 23YEL01]|uniref:hypothetical protein n=1 Tax=Deinococcus sp. 23YEL01 TaxID=2745871 RepID=UPI001E3F3DA4|nr:hypothetical protein [Deinococcus sp. 23YEL01]MCD0168139.1 hypothetical protein [Deinococcus sp. 23YEL01]